MSRIIDDDPPIKTGVASDAYRANYDRIFGECTECLGTGCVIYPDVDPATVETEGDLLKDCRACTPEELAVDPLESDAASSE